MSALVNSHAGGYLLKRGLCLRELTDSTLEDTANLSDPLLVLAHACSHLVNFTLSLNNFTYSAFESTSNLANLLSILGLETGNLLD